MQFYGKKSAYYIRSFTVDYFDIAEHLSAILHRVWKKMAP